MKKTILTLAALSISTLTFSFEWPVELINVESIKSFFGQFRGGKISSSLVLSKKEIKEDEESKPEEIKSCDEGRILTYIYSLDDDNDFFPSTLGNAVIINHEDNIMSVYGNLSLAGLEDDYSETLSVSSGAKIGEAGNSAWQENENGVEIEIIDTKNKTAINPRILLPRLEKEGTFLPSEIIFESKDGKQIELSNVKTFHAGVYKVYQKRNATLVPQKITLSLNGNIEDEYSFDSIAQENNSVYLNGRTKKYPGNVIYPDDKLLFIGEVKLSSGKSVITFENTNHLGDKRTVNYNITVY